MTPDELVRRFPQLYHMAEDGTWPSIRRHGLLSTSAILDLFALTGPARAMLESQQRSEMVTLESADLGTFAIRDQKPLPANRLAGCLEDGLLPEQWYRLLNGRVFFWLTEERLNRLLGARAYRRYPHTVLVLDTRMLVEKYLDAIELSPINSGATYPMARPRGTSTFRTVDAFDAREPAELSVRHSIPDIENFVVRIERRHPGGSLAAT